MKNLQNKLDEIRRQIFQHGYYEDLDRDLRNFVLELESMQIDNCLSQVEEEISKNDILRVSKSLNF